MLNRIYLDDRGLLQIVVVGDQTEASVHEMGDKLGFFVQDLRGRRQPILVLDNLTRLGQTTSEARREVARLARTLSFDRLAMVGDGSRMMRYGTNLMLRAIGKPNIRYFNRLEPAEKWLLSALSELSVRPDTLRTL